MEYKNFKDFAYRTKLNLDLIRSHVDNVSSRGYEVTELINSFLGLLIILDEIPSEILQQKSITEIGVIRLLGVPLNNGRDVLTFKDFVHNLRNAFAHGNIQFIFKNHEVNSIILLNYFRDSNTPSWECNLKIEDLENLFDLFYKTIMELP